MVACTCGARRSEPDGGSETLATAAAVGAGAAGGQDHYRKQQAAFFDLPGQFQPGPHITQGSQRVGAATGHCVEACHIAEQTFGLDGALLVGVVKVFDQFDLGVEQLDQQAVAVAQLFGVVGARGIFQQGDTA